MVASLLILETCGDTAAQKARVGTAMANLGPKERVHHLKRCTSTTLSAGLLKSSGRIGQARWWRSLSRIGSLGG